MRLKTLVNVSVKMSAKMMNALNTLETRCNMLNIDEMEEHEIREYLFENYGKDMEDEFNPSFMFTAKVA